MVKLEDLTCGLSIVGLEFHIYSPLLEQASPSGNPFEDKRQLIVRLDQLSRDEELVGDGSRLPGLRQEKLLAAGWDLLVFDEAHKLAANYFGTKLEPARQLACRFYTLCERAGMAEDARAYNELITWWIAIESAGEPADRQGRFFQ